MGEPLKEIMMRTIQHAYIHTNIYTYIDVYLAFDHVGMEIDFRGQIADALGTQLQDNLAG